MERIVLALLLLVDTGTIRLIAEDRTVLVFKVYLRYKNSEKLSLFDSQILN